MGTWGGGSFENDAAMDFVAELESLDDLQKPLVLARDVEQIDADLAAQIVVVAEVVAAQRGYPCDGLPEDLSVKLADMGFSQAVFEEVRNQLSAVIAHSELAELWAEGDAAEWNRAMTDLIERLGKPRTKVGGKPRKTGKKQPATNSSPCMFCDQPMGDGAFHMLDVTINDDEISAMKMGGWTHLKCLNAALHPKHIIQHWQFQDDEIEAAVDKLLGRDEG